MAKAQNLQQAIANMLRNIEQDEAVSAYGENLDNMLGYLNLDIQRQKAINNQLWLPMTEPLFEVMNRMRVETNILHRTQDVLKNKLSGHFKKDEIGEMCCMGRCHENASFNYNGKNYWIKGYDKKLTAAEIRFR